jgi:hypothetical protein
MSSSEIYCSSCGARNDSEAAFCSGCGARLIAPPPPVETTPPPPPRPAVTAPPPPPVSRPVAGDVRPASAKGNPLPLLLALGAIAVLLVVVVIEAALIFLPQGTGSEAGGATVSALQGQILIQKGGQGEWIEVAQDLAVEAGDRIRTADASHAILTFLEGTTTELSELTELTVGELDLAGGGRVVVRLDLDVGQIWNQIAELPADSIHEVSTLAAKVTCHGSEYGVAVNAMGTTYIRGQEGRVEVSAGGRTVPLVPGDTLMVELGSAPVSYGAVAMLPTPPTDDTSDSVSASVESVDMPTFLNQPLPTGTPTNTPPPTSTRRPVQPSPTPTSPPQPSPTKKSVRCPKFTIRVPALAPARGPFGIEFEKEGALPTGGGPDRYWYAVEFTTPGGQWTRGPVPANVQRRGQYLMAEVRAPGAGTFWWRICLVNPADPTGPSVCCSDPWEIDHITDEPCTT